MALPYDHFAISSSDYYAGNLPQRSNNSFPDLESAVRFLTSVEGDYTYAGYPYNVRRLDPNIARNERAVLQIWNQRYELVTMHVIVYNESEDN